MKGFVRFRNLLKDFVRFRNFRKISKSLERFRKISKSLERFRKRFREISKSLAQSVRRFSGVPPLALNPIHFWKAGETFHRLGGLRTFYHNLVEGGGSKCVKNVPFSESPTEDLPRSSNKAYTLSVVLLTTQGHYL